MLFDPGRFCQDGMSATAADRGHMLPSACHALRLDTCLPVAYTMMTVKKRVRSPVGRGAKDGFPVS